MLGVASVPRSGKKKGITLIESIYIDVAGDRRTSRYTILIEKLYAAEQAKKLHDQMMARVSHRHAQAIAQARKELEAEGERLRKIIQVAKG
jgi:hypothetical protein